MQMASKGRRFTASVIDIILIAGLLYAMARVGFFVESLVLGSEMSGSLETHNLRHMLDIRYAASVPPELQPGVTLVKFMGKLQLLLWLAATWAFYTLFEASAVMGTPGKRLVGVAVTDLNGLRISRGRATGRFLGRVLLTVFVGTFVWAPIFFVGFFLEIPALVFGAFFVALLCLFVPMTKKSDRLHDRLSRTMLIERGCLVN